MATSSTDVSDVVAQAQQQNAVINSMARGVVQNNDVVQAVGSQIVENLKDQAADTAVIAGQQGAGALQSQTGSIAAADALGTNMSDPSEIMTGLATQLKDAYAKAGAAQDKIAAVSSGGGIGGALRGAILSHAATSGKTGAAFLASAITGGATTQLKAQQGRIELLTGEIQNLNANTQEIVKTQKDIAPVLSAASVAAQTDLASRQITAQGLLAAQKNAQLNTAGIMDVIQLGQQQLGNSIQVQNLQLSAAQRVLVEQQTQLAIEERTQRIRENQLNNDGLEQMAGWVKAGLATTASGTPQGASLLAMPTTKLVAVIKANPDMFRDAANIGMMQQLTGQNIISSDPGKSAVIVAQTNAQLSPDQLPLKGLLARSLELARSGSYAGQTTTGQINAPSTGRIAGPGQADDHPVINTKDKDQVTSAAGANAKYFSLVASQNIQYADNSNIYQAPTVNSVVAMKALQGNPFVEKILKPLVSASPKMETNPEQLVDTAIAAVQQKQISFNDAQNGLDLYFKAAINYNNASKNYKQLGLPEQFSYRTPLKLSDGTQETVDMNNPSQVTKFITNRLLRRSNTVIPGLTN